MASFVAPGSDADAHYIAMIRCDDGIILNMERAEMSAVSTDQAWEIIGTKGSLHMPMLQPAGQPHTLVLDRFVPGKGTQSEVIWSGGKEKAVNDVVRDFVRAIREGGVTETSLERALIMQQITDAVYDSAAKGRSVAIRS
jgi:predicted dehydrogenase